MRKAAVLNFKCPMQQGGISMKKLSVDSALLRRNLLLLRENAGTVPIVGNLMGDACGLGLIKTANLLWSEGVRFFAVSSARDAHALRQEGLREAEILLLHSTTDASELELLLDASGIATIGSLEAAMALNGIAERRATVAEAHIKLDTGAGQFGFSPSEIAKVESVYRDLQCIAISGVYTTCAPGGAGRHHEQHVAMFEEALATLRGKGLETGLTYALDAATLLRRHEKTTFGAVMVDGMALSGRVGFHSPLQPAGCITSQVTEVLWLPKGTELVPSGRLRKPTKAGLIPVGYGDGFGLRRPPQGLRIFVYPGVPAVYVEGQRVPVLGGIGPDSILVNLMKSSASAGAVAQLDANPMFCKGLPKEFT